MKKQFIIFVLLCLGSCTKPAQDNLPKGKLLAPSEVAAFTWEQQIVDFGTIEQNKKVSHTFVFVNKGPAALVITDAKGSCGCTVADFPKDPIAKGQKGKITVSFNPAGKQGMQTKVVTLLANTKSGSERIVIKANIKPE